MIELSRGLSFVLYTYEGGALRFPVPFPYLLKAHVWAFVGEPGEARMVPVTWVDQSTIEIPNQDGMLTAPYTVTVRRVTPIDKPMVNFKNGANLPAADLNRALLQLLYAQQESIDTGSGGIGGGLPGGGGGIGGGYADVNEIVDQILRSPAMQTLLTRVEMVDMNSESLLQEIIRSNDYFDTKRDFSSRISRAFTEIVLLQDDTATVAQQYTDLLALFNTEQGVNAARYEQINTAVATETEARATAITALSAKIDNTAAAVWTELDTKATPEQASALAATQLQAFKDGDYAVLREEFNVTAGEHDAMYGQWSASWSIRINAGTLNGAPVISGISLSADPATGSNFIVMADRFAIAHPQYTSGGTYLTTKFPFVVGTVGGLSTVGIQGQLLVDGSITADKITANSLSAISANLGEVNGGTFRTYQLNADGSIKDANEFRVEMTNKPTDNYPLWIGSGVKNANNAVMWVDRAGNAKFAGTVSALNLTDQLQAHVTGSWSGDIQASVGGVTSSITLPAPVRPGESHTPLILAEVDINITDNDGAEAADAKVYIERLTGGTWVTVRQQTLAGFKFTSMGSSMILFDSPTTTSTTYRVRVDGAGSAHPVDIHLVGTSMAIFGLR